MSYNSNILLRDLGMIFCKINRFISLFFRNGRVKFLFVELYELAILLFDVAEPVNDFVNISPLMKFQLRQQVFVDALQKNFTYFSDLTF